MSFNITLFDFLYCKKKTFKKLLGLNVFVVSLLPASVPPQCHPRDAPWPGSRSKHRQGCITVMARWPARAGRGDSLSRERFVRGAGADGRIATAFSLGHRGDSGLKNGALHDPLR